MKTPKEWIKKNDYGTGIDYHDIEVCKIMRLYAEYYHREKMKEKPVIKNSKCSECNELIGNSASHICREKINSTINGSLINNPMEQKILEIMQEVDRLAQEKHYRPLIERQHMYAYFIVNMAKEFIIWAYYNDDYWHVPSKMTTDELFDYWIKLKKK